jgi:hypothetical protein
MTSRYPLVLNGTTIQELQTGDTLTGFASSGANSDITSLSGLTTPLSPSQGGTGISSLAANVATFLATPSSANLAAALTDETGTGANVFANTPTLIAPILGTPTSGTVTNLTGTASININGTVGATTATTGAFTTLSASGTTTLSGNQIISVTDNSNAALRIAQLGSGNALLVEDSANPDVSPFVIDANGNIVVGSTTPLTNLAVSGAPKFQVIGGSSIAGIGIVRTDASGAILSLNGGSSGNNLANGSGAGFISAGGYDGSNYVETGRIEFRVDGTPGTNDMPGRLVFSTTADGASTPTERMRIDSAGNVGIGAVPSASAILDAQSTTKGVRMPNMTTTQKNAIASPAAGLMVFDTTLAKLCVYTGAAWQTITSV